MRGSLVHDALHQWMRDEGLPEERWRDTADRELQRRCLEGHVANSRLVGSTGPCESPASPESRKTINVAP
jgi:hypothetical protein